MCCFQNVGYCQAKLQISIAMHFVFDQMIIKKMLSYFPNNLAQQAYVFQRKMISISTC